MLRKMVVVTLLLSLVAVVNANSVGNPDFETGLFDDWYHSAGALIISDNGPSAPGSYAAEVAAGQDIRTVPFPVTAGETYDVSFDYKVINADGWFWGGIRYWADENATIWKGQDLFGHDLTDWTTRSFTSQPIPDGAAYADVAFFTGTATTGSIIVDNVSVVPEPVTLSVLALGGLAVIRRRK